MSRTREVIGQDDRGRPIARWAEGEPVARQFGHMEPAFDRTAIERRQLSPEELAERTRPPVPVLVIADSQRDRFRVANGADEPITKPGVYAQEEAIVSEEPAIRPTNIPEIIPEPLEQVDLQRALTQLTLRAGDAQNAWIDKLQAAEAANVADAKWAEASELLERSWRLVADGLGLVDVGAMRFRSSAVLGEPDALGELIEEMQLEEASASVALDHDERVQTQSLPEPSATEPASEPAVEHPEAVATADEATPWKRESPKPNGLTRRQQQVLDAVLARKGNLPDAARQLGVSRELVNVTLKAVGRKGFLPVELIPSLPASFAQFATVPA